MKNQTENNKVVQGHQQLDMLEEIFKKQKELQDRLGNKDLVGNQAFINIMMLAVEDELKEALRETPWKPWKKQQQFNQEKYKEELIDALHFFVNLCLSAGMNAKEVHERYCGKNKENFARQDRGY